MSPQPVETLLKQDFTHLAAVLEGDGFAERVLKGLEHQRRFRLAAVGLAGGAGALFAGLQLVDFFPALTPALDQLPPGSLTGALSPQLLAAAALAVALAATAMVLQGDR